jgi:hypothetical protein
MKTFNELVADRKKWLSEILKPWCQAARRSELLKAEPEWLDIAGKVDPTKTLWIWAWSRFPELVHESLGIEETSEVEIQLNDGRSVRGFPDARASQHGQLFLLGTDHPLEKLAPLGPFSIDEIVAVNRVSLTENSSK